MCIRDRGDCEDRLEENPYIQEAQVSRKLPSSIEIHVKERQEAAVIQMDQEYVVIDEGGFVLQIAEKAPRFTLLTDITITDAKEGEVVSVEAVSYTHLFWKILCGIWIYSHS